MSFGGVLDAFVVKLVMSGTPSAPSTRVLSYAYDGLQRLTRAMKNPGAVYTYTFDLAGNCTDVWQDGLPLEHHDYNTANQKLGWTYHAAGNLINNGTAAYTYDALNHTTARQHHLRLQPQVGAARTDYIYDLNCLVLLYSSVRT